MLPIDVAYLVAPWFLFIVVFGDNKYLPHAAILLLMAVVNILFVDVLGLNGSLGYIEDKYFLMWYDILISLFMITLLMIDKQAWKHALILVFAALCHFMIIYDLTIHSSFASNIFYTLYDELIISVGILQMAITHNGLTSALGNIREFIHRTTSDSWYHSKGVRPYSDGGKDS